MLARISPILLALVIASRGAAQPPQAPSRDSSARPPTAGTATIRGTVLAGDTGKPLRRARITATAPELAGEPRNTSTDADGRYELTDLPAGRYTLRVTRSGYLSLRYGQRRPLEQGQPLQILDKQTVEHVDFSLPRMGLITGRIADENNEPIEGVNVYALRSMYFNGRRQFVPTGAGPQIRTDDAGQYRLLGLAPGTYLVQAMTRETWSVTQNGSKEVLGYAPTYFPGTTNVTSARKVTVKLGREAGAIDFALMPGRAATISGHAFDAHGKPFQNVTVGQEVRGDDFASFGSVASGHVEADGSFVIRNVPPGAYVLGATTGRDVSEPSAALLPLIIDGADITNIELVGSSGGTVTGQVLADDGSVPSITRLRISVSEYARGQASPMVVGLFRNSGSSEVGADGHFQVAGVFSRSRLRVLGLPDDWAMKAVLHDGTDIAEQPIDLRSGEVLGDVQGVLTKNVTHVTGQLADTKGQPLADGTVILFSTDSSAWTEDSRFIRTARPDQRGKWQITGAPPGEYFIVAVDTVEDGQWFEREYLESVRQYAQKVVLAPTEAQSVQLKLLTLNQQ
jgi:hypothetical protein